MINSGVAESIPAKTSRTDTEPAKQTVRARRTGESSGEENNNGLVRYFLGKAESNDRIPALEKEVNTEGEALVESLRQGVTFYAVQEFRVVPDLTGRRPQLTKEPVPGKKT
jgi:hypothetical protein